VTLSSDSPKPVDAEKEEDKKKKKKRPNIYPLCWPIGLSMPLNRLGGRSIAISGFCRGSVEERDQDTQWQARDELALRARREGNWSLDEFDMHHSVPLFLGGRDDVTNLIPLRKGLHSIGHRVLNQQPQNALPPAGIDKISHYLPNNQVGTKYFLAGFKQTDAEICPEAMRWQSGAMSDEEMIARAPKSCAPVPEK